VKIKLDIDCTPEEARAFLGLPDVAPMQKAVMDKLQGRLEAAAEGFDPQTVIKTWFPDAMKNWDQWQKAFWPAGGPPGRKDD